MGGLFLMLVDRDGAGFVALGDLEPGQALSAPPPQASLSHGAFVSALKAQLAARLVQDGLYTDEAVAMVDTWERAYFLTPGLRLLYLLPQVHTDRLIPLSIEPPPQRLARTMVIRTEIVPPEQERAMLAWLQDLASNSAALKQAATARFLALGRFAEPLLSRAQALTSDPAQRTAAEALLAQVRQHRRWAPLAAE